MIARADALTALASEHFDVVVVGGGITGAGCALDAATRGYSVARDIIRRDYDGSVAYARHHGIAYVLLLGDGPAARIERVADGHVATVAVADLLDGQGPIVVEGQPIEARRA